MLSHFATNALDTQPQNASLIYIERAHGDAQFMDAINLLFPHPVGYKKVWSQNASDSGKAPLFVWEPIPPISPIIAGGGSAEDEALLYCAMGVACTTSPDEPPLNAVRCIAANLVTLTPPNSSRFIWRDARAAGGSPGSFWHSNALRCLAVAPSHYRSEARPGPGLTPRFGGVGSELTLPRDVKQCVKAAMGWTSLAEDAAAKETSEPARGEWMAPCYYDRVSDASRTSGAATAPFAVTNAKSVTRYFPTPEEQGACNLGVDDSDSFWKSGHAQRPSSVVLFYASGTGSGARSEPSRAVMASQLKLLYRHNHAEGMDMPSWPTECALHVLTQHGGSGSWDPVVQFALPADGVSDVHELHVYEKVVKFPRTVSGVAWRFTVLSTKAGEAAKAKPEGGLFGWAKSMVTTDSYGGSGADIVHVGLFAPSNVKLASIGMGIFKRSGALTPSPTKGAPPTLPPRRGR